MDSQPIQQRVISKKMSMKQSKNLKDYVICLKWDDLIKEPSTRGRTILLLSLAIVFLDPLFFYVPVVNNRSTCLGLDKNLRIIVVVFRSFVDVLHTILWWHQSLFSLRGHRTRRSWAVAILAVLPLPQVVVFAISWQQLTMNFLMFIVLMQSVLRICRIFPAYKDATKINKLLIYSWFAAAFNLVLYALASNVLGAIWYLHAIERNIECWRQVCHKNMTLCGDPSFYCDDTSSYNGYLHMQCSILQAYGKQSFDYGIYEEAFQTKIIEKNSHFLNKFLQCFWWGLRNLSSLGQNLKTSNYIWDSFFAISIAISGLVLFALLIGNMQTYLQTIWSEHTNSHAKSRAELERMAHESERMKQKKNNLQRWVPFSLLSEDLREEVNQCKDRKWQETVEVNLQSLLNNLPTALGEKLKLHLCNDLFSKIPDLNKLRNLARRDLCFMAKPLVYPERSHIFREGDPICEVVLVLHGKVLSYSKQSTQNEVRVEQLSDGCILGEELLQQLKQVAQQQQAPNKSSFGLPIASKTIQAITTVEAFALSGVDLNIIYSLSRTHV